MPRPVRFNPMDVEVIQNLPSSMPLDPVYGDGIQDRVEAPPIVLRGQVNNNRRPARFESRMRRATGDQETGSGHVVFRKTDLDGLGVTLKKGDRFVRFGGETVDFVIATVRPESPLRGVFLLIYAEFEEPQYTQASV